MASCFHPISLLVGMRNEFYRRKEVTITEEAFKDRVVLVTGAGSGLGRASSLLFAKRGANVVVGDIDAKTGQRTVAMIRDAGGEAIFVEADVTKEAEVEMMVSQAVQTYGRLDCAFNNVGISQSSATHEATEEQWDYLMDTNLKGIWLCMKHEVKHMLEHGGGTIVNTSSLVGVIGAAGGALYATSKWGVLGLTKSTALEYIEAGIRINAVCPGGMSGTHMAHTGMGEQADPEWVAARLKEIPIKRQGSVDEVAETVLWLCSDASSYVVGHALLVDGGATVH